MQEPTALASVLDRAAQQSIAGRSDERNNAKASSTPVDRPACQPTRAFIIPRRLLDFTLSGPIPLGLELPASSRMAPYQVADRPSRMADERLEPIGRCGPERRSFFQARPRGLFSARRALLVERRGRTADEIRREAVWGAESSPRRCRLSVRRPVLKTTDPPTSLPPSLGGAGLSGVLQTSAVPFEIWRCAYAAK